MAVRSAVLGIDRGGFQYGVTTIFSNVSFLLDDARTALVGENGAGKSTLLKCLAGEHDLSDGQVVRSRGLRVGYVPQEIPARLMDVSVREMLEQALPEGGRDDTWKVDVLIDDLRIPLDLADKRFGELSGGWQRLLLIAAAKLGEPDIVILDEPTNHLDIDARGELLTALNDFDGAVVLVSHDRRLIEATADRLMLVANGEVTPFDGDLDDYRKFLLSGDNAPTRTVEAEPVAKPKDVARRDNAERRRQLKPLKDKIEGAEHQIAELNIELAKCDKSLSDPLLFSKDPARGKAVSKKRADAAKKLADVEARWLKMQEEYESAMAEA